MTVGAVEGPGRVALGELANAEPLQALEDALVDFDPEEILLSTHPSGRSHWLGKRPVGVGRHHLTCL